MEALLDLQHVRRAFAKPVGGELLVLDDVDLTLREGEIAGLLGRSGSGKSTLLRIIAGLAPPTAGSVAYMGHPVAAAVALQSSALHAALFLSAETATAFVRLLPPELAASLKNVVALTIGKGVDDALKPLPWRQVRLAPSPTLDDVLALL